MSWKDKNKQEWNRLDSFFEIQTAPPLIWITSNRHLLRESLISEFQVRFPKFKHHRSSAWGYDLYTYDSISDFLKSLLGSNQTAQLVQPIILHIPSIARYLPTIYDEYSTDLMAVLEGALLNDFQEWPFTVMFWTDLAVKTRFEKHLPLLIEKEVPHFHFESKKRSTPLSLPAPIQVPPNLESVKFEKKWQKIITELENKRATSQFSYSDGDQLANNYNTIGNYIAEAKCRIEILENLKDLSLKVQRYQFYRTAQAHSASGNWKKAILSWEKSNEVFRTLYKKDSANGFLKVGQLLILVGDHKTAQYRLETALKLAIEQCDLFTRGLVLREQGKEAERNADGKRAEEYYWSSAELLLLDGESEDAQFSMQLLAELWIGQERFEEAILVLTEAYNLFEYYQRGINHRIVQLIDFTIENLGRDREDEFLLSLFDCGEVFQELRIKISKHLGD